MYIWVRVTYNHVYDCLDFEHRTKRFWRKLWTFFDAGAAEALGHEPVRLGAGAGQQRQQCDQHPRAAATNSRRQSLDGLCAHPSGD